MVVVGQIPAVTGPAAASAKSPFPAAVALAKSLSWTSLEQFFGSFSARFLTSLS
jgi:hypothetical protein